jgi:peptidoglycan/xylan/chitin deacetylase (PgdA/CDA1 family)
MLRNGKIGVLRFAEAAGVSRFLSGSAWRRHRLLILCYHGISRHDEHEWSDLYISADTFRRRLDLLVEARCNVLSLTEAAMRLQNNSLPDRAVVITFDDGFHDFYTVAFPILRSFAFPVTLYLTTYYVDFNRPVFDPMCSYLLWKGRHNKSLSWPEVLPSPISLAEDVSRKRAASMIQQYALFHKLSGREKDSLLAKLAGLLNIDYEDLCRKRVMHLVTAAEAKELGALGVDIQYHTHRHREYRTRERMFAELHDNHRRIATFTSTEPRHFCYTGGFYLPQHLGFLKDYGMLTATTCKPGLCTSRTDPMTLPRLVDSPALSDLEFRAWLAGTASLLPRRPHHMSEGQLGEEELATA